MVLEVGLGSTAAKLSPGGACNCVRASGVQHSSMSREGIGGALFPRDMEPWSAHGLPVIATGPSM